MVAIASIRFGLLRLPVRVRPSRGPGRSAHLEAVSRPYDPPMPFDVGNFVLFTVLLSIGLPLLITVIVIVTIVWAIRRATPGGKQAADAELRDRLARGEIDPTEFAAREDALKGQP